MDFDLRSRHQDHRNGHADRTQNRVGYLCDRLCLAVLTRFKSLAAANLIIIAAVESTDEL